MKKMNLGLKCFVMQFFVAIVAAISFGVTVYACETAEPTDICINARSISFADGIITITYANVDTGETLNFHQFIQEFPIIMTDANGRTMCLQMQIDSLNPMGYSGLFDGVLANPITLTNAPSPYQYDVVRVDRTYGGAIDWAFSAGDFRAALERINFRIYLRPNANHHMHTAPEQPTQEVTDAGEEDNLPINLIQVGFWYYEFVEGADIERDLARMYYNIRPLNIGGVKVGLYHGDTRIAYAVSERRTYFGGSIIFEFPNFYQSGPGIHFVDKNLTLEDVGLLSVRIIDGAGHTWINGHDLSIREGTWERGSTRLSTRFWTSSILESLPSETLQIQPPAITPSPWAQEGVSRALTLGLVPSTLQTAYSQPTTRAEFAALAVALYETATGRVITGRMEFNDTSDINVQKMGYLGVVAGVGGGNFAPNNTLTREQAAVMLARLADVIGQPLPPSDPTFADNANISLWATDAVGQIQAAGIMGGVGNNQFAPSDEYTREQSIITILRLFDILN